MLTDKERTSFDADGTGVPNNNFMAFPYDVERCDLVLLPVEWDVTTSYGTGTSIAPSAIIKASIQIEIYDPQYPRAWHRGIATLSSIGYGKQNNDLFRTVAEEVIEDIQSGHTILTSIELNDKLNKINLSCQKLNQSVYNIAKEYLDRDKIVGIIGGDHSTPLGLIQALCEKQQFGILHIDAHADLRDSYEGFEYSHASIMFNVMKLNNITQLTQIGIRDMCYAEKQLVDSDPRIKQFTDLEMHHNLFNGVTWHEQCLQIIDTLPQNIYISFDIDGVEQSLCPSTGTPVPGGMSYNQIIYLLKQLEMQDKKIIGFDMVEVSPSQDGEWDANVGARILYKLCGVTLETNKL